MQMHEVCPERANPIRQFKRSEEALRRPPRVALDRFQMLAQGRAVLLPGRQFELIGCVGGKPLDQLLVKFRTSPAKSLICLMTQSYSVSQAITASSENGTGRPFW